MTPLGTSLVFLIIIIILAVIGLVGFRARMLTWGSTKVEASTSMAGDGLIGMPILISTRAVTVREKPEVVWSWLAQIGQGRGGFYSYDWLENLLGMDIHSSEKIIPALQDIQPGDLIPFWRGSGINVSQVDPPHRLLLAGTLNQPGSDRPGEGMVGGTWEFLLIPSTVRKTRLIVRSRVAAFKPAWLSWLLMRMLEPLHFIMERRMLLGIKARAEEYGQTDV